ncbi:diacylglycerol/lipid kinase family protein [Candidatus Contubernalis alkaliaceticus]|uniref:diacylglycerol/lipid kinase family protein n=1 Tax=Candidatus Contubernalis alkaliaceticus TaxID=338645 RepID=UPI001F4C4063|nr:diacylglycerol kinase family protein [Candidatus Contubernalis alkalaceticus]UNC90668.1 diacylglycerol kinase family lipid kinase [Candidatus Contubernalis alkalaceticus]
MEWFVIVNPAAGKGKVKKLWPDIESYLKKQKICFTYEFTRGLNHARELACRAMAKKIKKIIVVGGDGTIFEVINGIDPGKVTLGIIPMGTGNDFARTAGIPQDWKKACRVLANGNEMPVDLGRINEYYFINLSGTGLDAMTVCDANRLKKYLGKISYVVGLLKQLICFKPIHIEVLGRDLCYSARAWMVSVANGKYYGNGMMVAPRALLDDGLLDIIIVEELPRLEFLKVFPQVYKGTHLDHPKVRFFRERELEIKTQRPLPVHCDGEILNLTSLKYSVVPGKLTIKVPGTAETLVLAG